MSEFSEACKKLIEISGTNVYQIAKVSGLDRTTLQKMVQGNRLPSQRFVEAFCDNLLINNTEREELLRLFQMEKIGRDKYFCRCEVENMLCNFRNLKNSLEKPFFLRSVFVQHPEDGGRRPIRKLSLEVEIITALQYVIQRACASDAGSIPIYMDIFPGAFYAIQQIIQERKNGNDRIRCCQLVNFYHKNGSTRGLQKNVQNLHTVISFALACPEDYELRYFYKTIDEPDPCRIWPHYVVTERDVLLLAEDGRSGILMEDEEIAGVYLSRLRTMRKAGKNLFTFTGGADALLTHYGENVLNGKMVVSFDTGLCMGEIIPDLITQEMIENQPLAQEYLALCQRRDEEGIFGAQYKRCTCLGGIQSFLDTGELPGIYSLFFDPVPQEKRLEILEKYADGMEARQNEYLLKPDLPIPADGLNFELYEPDRVFIYSLQNTEDFGCLLIEEAGAFGVFKDYFETLAEEGKAYDAQESCRVFREAIRRMEDA